MTVNGVPNEEIEKAGADLEDIAVVPERETFPLTMPEAGAYAAGINVGVVSNETGRAFVRLLIEQAGAAICVDIPMETSDGTNVAELIGSTIVREARRGTGPKVWTPN